MQDENSVDPVLPHTNYFNRITAQTAETNSRLEVRENLIHELYTKSATRSIHIRRNRLRLASCWLRREAEHLLRQCSLLHHPLQQAEVVLLKQQAERLLNQSFDLEIEACRLEAGLD